MRALDDILFGFLIFFALDRAVRLFSNGVVEPWAQRNNYNKNSVENWKLGSEFVALVAAAIFGLQIQEPFGALEHGLEYQAPVFLMNRFRDETAEMCRVKGWDKAPISIVWMLLGEEMGELASSIRQNHRIYKKTGLKKDQGVDITMEMGDVFSYLFQLASMLNVDLDTMWELHRQKVQTKVYPRMKNNMGIC